MVFEGIYWVAITWRQGKAIRRSSWRNSSEESEDAHWVSLDAIQRSQIAMMMLTSASKIYQR